MSTISRLYEYADPLPLTIVGSRSEEMIFDIIWDSRANLDKNQMQLKLSAVSNTASGDHVYVYVNNVIVATIQYHAFDQGKEKSIQPYFVPVQGKNIIRIVRTPAYDWVQNSELKIIKCAIFALWNPVDGIELPDVTITSKPKGTVTKMTETFSDEYGKFIVYAGVAVFLWFIFDRLILRKASGGWKFGDRVQDYFIREKNAP